jgi:uncharacterized protein YjdB
VVTLRDLIGIAEPLAANTSGYTPESLAGLNTALDAARTVAAKQNPSQAEVTGAVDRLRTAIGALVVVKTGDIGKGNDTGKSDEIGLKPGASVATVKAAQKSVNLVAKKSVTIPAVVYLSDGTSAASKALKWTSSNKKVAKVNATTGKITAVKAGSATIKATAKAKTAAGAAKTVSIKVKVVKKAPAKAKAKVKSAALASVPKTMTVGQVKAVTGSYKPGAAIGAKVTYKSSNAAVLSVDKAGTLKAFKAGKNIKITVKAGGKSKVYKVTVK